MKKPAKQKPVRYLSNTFLLPEIAKSKNTYSCYLDDHHSTYDLIVVPAEGDSVEATLKRQSLPEGSVVRVMTWDHIPLDPDRKARGREKNKTHAYCSFNPFAHYELRDGAWHIVGKSHWKGGLHNGHFSNDHGSITSPLAIALMKLVERYGSRGNWRGYSYNDEMRSQALMQLCQSALQFDESRTQNPFAYLTTIVTNSFTKVFNQEKKAQTIRDDLMVSMGQAPSMTRQVEHDMAVMGLSEPPPLKGKRGRPKSVKTDAVKRKPGRPKKVV